MELSNLQFKVHHKPGTAMGHVDGLSRLKTVQVNSLRMADLLNPVEPVDVVPDSRDAAEEEKEAETADDGHVSPVDVFRLDVEQFKAEQEQVSWVKDLVAFLQDGALPVDPFLRARVVRMAPRYVVTDGLLRRYVNLPARVGPARTLAVPVVPPSYVATILHYCHAVLLSSHLGLTKTTEKVKRLVYWPGWRKDVVEYLKECNKCGSGKGPRPSRAGVMLIMPVIDLAGPFDLLVVDAIGPLSETDSGNRYISVLVDYFTRWAEAFAVRRLDSVTFVEIW
ncbi:hypothetical protein PC123_g3848 [Phytophthora cactorum]|nr:hypothetical protein PC123_g3848 [Phytophthora cactorum]